MCNGAVRNYQSQAVWLSTGGLAVRHPLSLRFLQLPQILPAKIYIYEIIHNKYKTHVIPLPLCRREYFFFILLSFFLLLSEGMCSECVLRLVAKSLRCVRAKTQNLLEIIQFRGDFTRFHCSQCKRNRNEPNQTDKRAHRVTHSA